MNRTFRCAPARAFLLALLLAPLAASAQPGPDSARCGPGGAASGAGGCVGGRAMMSRDQAREQRAKMSSFKTYEECKAYVDERHEQMRARAHEQGRPMPEHPVHDPCSRLKPAQK
jgi:hypothetical protein